MVSRTFDPSKQSEIAKSRNDVTLKIMEVSNGFTVSEPNGTITAFTGDDALDDALDFMNDWYRARKSN